METEVEVGLELPWEAYLQGGVALRPLGITGNQAIIRTPKNQYIVVKPHVQRFATDLMNEVGVDSFGTYNGHSPPEGPTQALDVFNQMNQSGYALQDRMCNFAIKNQKKYGVRYCIRRHQIWNVERANEGFRNQRVTGNPTVDHLDHGHFTFYNKAEGSIDPVIEPSPVTTRKKGRMFFFWHKNTVYLASPPFRSPEGFPPDYVDELAAQGTPVVGLKRGKGEPSPLFDEFKAWERNA